jgi:hypothetical protein
MSFYRTIKSFKGISIYDFLKYAIIVTTLVTLYVKFIPNNYIKDQEKKLSTYDLIKLYANRFIHYALKLISSLYPLIVKNNITMDIIYILYESTGLMLWNMNGGCLLTQIETELLGSLYKNADRHYQPYYIVFTNGKTSCNKLSEFILVYSYTMVFYVTARTIYNILHKK